MQQPATTPALALRLACAALLAAGATAMQQPNVLTEAEQEAGWSSLFDGRSTEHWRGFRREGFPQQGWVVEDGTLRKVAGAGGGDIASARPYRDFEFAFEWEVAPGANSGVIYRSSEELGASWQTGLEYQILDDGGHGDGRNAKTSAAALYALVAAEPKQLRPVGEWNSGRVVVVGNRVEHWLNGARVVEVDLAGAAFAELVGASKFASMERFAKEPAGHIVLQDHGDDVWFRNLKVRDLAPDPAGGKALFDGVGLDGWTHHLAGETRPEDVWSVTEEGVLVCKGQPAGYLRTEDDYTNFVLHLDWRFPGAPGNSGVLLRMIGADKVWPRSIEAQLQSGAAGDFWNIDEFPMEVVAERTSGRNTRRTATHEKALGEWNHYEITVWKGDVVLRVNGEILNQAWGCLETPGKICLQSEGAEIHFKDIRIVPLP